MVGLDCEVDFLSCVEDFLSIVEGFFSGVGGFVGDDLASFFVSGVVGLGVSVIGLVGSENLCCDLHCDSPSA